MSIEFSGIVMCCDDETDAKQNSHSLKDEFTTDPLTFSMVLYLIPYSSFITLGNAVVVYDRHWRKILHI